ERFAAIECPIVELGTSFQREASEEVSAIEEARFLESAAVAGALEQLRVDAQFDCRRPSHAGAVGLENRLAECKVDAMKHPPQARAGGVGGALRPQQRGHDVPRHDAWRFREIDQ